MSQSKNEPLDIVDEVRLLIDKLRSLKNTQFKKIKQPEFREMELNGLVKKFSLRTIANNLLNPFTSTEQPIRNSELEVDETRDLWREIRIIFSHLEQDINAIASAPEEVRLPQQKTIFENALIEIGSKFARAIEIDADIRSFEYTKSDTYAAMQSLAKYKMDLIEEQIKSEPSSGSLNQKWQKAAAIISKEFQQEPTTQDYVNLLNAMYQLEELEKIAPKAMPQAQNVGVSRKKKKTKTASTEEVSKTADTGEDIEDNINFLSEINASLIDIITSQLVVLRMLETTKWKELKLESFEQNKALEKLEDFYRSALGNSSASKIAMEAMKRFASQISTTASKIKSAISGQEINEAIQLKQEVDARLLKLQADMNDFAQEAEKLKSLPANRGIYLQKANELLKEQNELLKKGLEEVNPIINKIMAIDEVLVDFNKSDKQDELFRAKKGEFDARYEPLVKEAADLEEKLVLELKNKNGPEIDAMKQEMDRLIGQLVSAHKKIKAVTKPDLGDYSHLLNSVFELNTAEEKIKNIFKKIEERIPEQKRENRLREEFATKRNMLLEAHEALKLPHTQFKNQDVQHDAIQLLDAVIPRFEEDLTHAPVKQVEEALDAINSTIKRLNEALLKAKVTPKVAQQHFRILCNKIQSSADPLLNSMEQLRDAPNYRDVHLTIDLGQYNRLKEILNQEDLLVVADDTDFDKGTSDLTLWSREELIAYCKQLAEFADITLTRGIATYSPKYNATDIANFEDAMAFGTQAASSQVNPFTLFNQMHAFISVASGDTDELDSAIKRIYENRSRIQNDFKQQYPDVDMETMPTFLTELQFSEEIARQVSNDDRQIQILMDIHNQDDLEAFLRQELDTYHYLQRDMDIPSSELAQHNNLSELSALRSSRDLITTAFKVHWLAVIQKQIEIEQAVNPQSQIMNDLLGLKQFVASRPIYDFLSERNLSFIEKKVNELKQQQVYYSFNHFYEIQQIALGQSLANNLAGQDAPTTDAEEKLQRVQGKISENAENHRLKEESVSLQRLSFPQDFYSFIEKSEDFLKWSNFLQESLGETSAQLISEEDKQFLQKVRLTNLDEEIKRIILTAPQDAEQCFDLVSRLNQFAAQGERLSEIREKWIGMMDKVLEAYPSESKPYNPGFYGAKQVDEWIQINNFINNPQVEENLRQYRANRAQLEKIKEHGFDPKIDYKSLLTELRDNKQILDMAREQYQTLENMRKQNVGEKYKKLTEAMKVLGALNEGIIKTFKYSEDLTEEHKKLLMAVNKNMINLFEDGEKILRNLDLDTFYRDPDKFKATIDEASNFLTNLPTTVSQCFDKTHYDALDEAGLDAMDKAYNMVMEAIAELYKNWGWEFKYERAVGKVTQDYKARINAITDQFKESEEAISMDTPKSN
ncbi:hypothetical protein OQJ19_03520 [Fluoribacter gormanii]|uniref:hypothetical protein n=1 Tax=Fluoribacter gormanii TaxID=464 RepID=UPI0022448946|nr:hypothetical protein [Fluoribacter gormanii]MCW8469727.1 hypothetical protein [Fluoribacter gormanii]